GAGRSLRGGAGQCRPPGRAVRQGPPRRGGRARLRLRAGRRRARARRRGDPARRPWRLPPPPRGRPRGPGPLAAAPRRPAGGASVRGDGRPRGGARGVGRASAAGASVIVLTNAAGGINTSYGVGQPVLISDHLTLPGRSPLSGPPPPEGYPPRFADLTEVYS